MPQTFNLSNSIQGLNANVRSVRCWFYDGPFDPHGYPQPPTPMPTLIAETSPVTDAHYIVFEGFDRTNANGNSLGRGSIDTGTVSAQEYYQATTLEAILLAAFG
jgi:hypothetical protein